jgi:polysaccharide deacetylase family protein (PEP-CTERM system associated)
MAPPDGVVNALTVDTEDWFHICGVSDLTPERWPSLPSRVELTTRLLLDDMNSCGARGTFLVVGWVAERYPRLVEEILAAGHEVGSHGHLHRRAYEMTPAAFEEDLQRSVRALRDAGAPPIRAFRAPEWSINERSLWALGRLAAGGIRIDGSMAPVKIVGDVGFPRGPHIRTTADGPIVEMPPLVADRFGQVMPAGWGWGLRASSPARVCRTIERVNRLGNPAVLAVHPWEIDPDPPRIGLPARLRFAHYFRLDGFRDRLKDVMRHIHFGTLSEAAERVAPVH